MVLWFDTGGTLSKKYIENLSMTPKSQNEVGLQIADLISNRIGRQVLRMKSKIGHEVDYSVLKKKLGRKSKGLIILPK